MVEAVMYAGIGFLFAILMAVSVAPLIHNRAVRLTIRRLKNALPQSMAEIQADKDLLRADFALLTRRLEMTVEHLKADNANHRAELGRKDDIINRFKIDRDTQNVELLLLRAEVAALKEQLAPDANDAAAAQDSPGELETISVVPSSSPAFHGTDAPASASDRLIADAGQLHESAASYAETEATARLRPDLATLPRVRDRTFDRVDSIPAVPLPETEETSARADRTGADNRSGRREQPAHEAARPSAVRRDASIHLSPDDHVVAELPRRPRRSGMVPLAASLAGVAALAWAYSDEDAKTVVAAWVSAIGPRLPTLAAKPPPTQQPEAQPASAGIQIEELTRQAAEKMHATIEQASAGREQAPPQSEQAHKEAPSTSLPPPQRKLVAVPETPPTTIPGWIVRDVANGTAVVQGPNGVWRVARGDSLPGVGRVDSIVRWGNRWIVATSRGLISTP
ncbi:MAG TPA: hypothetical protein VFB29_04945 [Pseudolabrys sp.]|nr:hypothetical protein [Pseudolabrys sp.]